MIIGILIGLALGAIITVGVLFWGFCKSFRGF